MSSISILVLIFCFELCTSAKLTQLESSQNDIQKYTIQMIGYTPVQNDDYVAVSREAIPGYIVGFEPMANADRVHHMLLYGCTNPAQEDTFWRGMQTCGWGGGSYILYAWARNAPNLNLPKDVAFSVGHDFDGIKYFVLQVHYAQPFDGEVHDFSGVTLHISQKKPMNLAAVMLFVSGTPIPPQMAAFQNNITCLYESTTPIHPFAFRTHTHAMGRVVSAYYKHQGQWSKIGRRNPQWPQLFESIPNKLTISRGDQMSASCRFDSMDKNRTVNMGAMGVDEMCNFYMMFHWDAKLENPFPQGAICGRDSKELMRDYPLEGFELLPKRPELEHHAHQSKIPFGVVPQARHHSLGDSKLGQVAGLAFDNSGKLAVFHRAKRVWDASTFDNYNYLLDKTPINEDVILLTRFEGNKSIVEKKLGKGLFYLPHGIYIDSNDIVYTTDVGSHTVAKWRIKSDSELEKIWESGQKLTPGSDSDHFCKPTGVTRIGDMLYVSDGYCNSRVVVLDVNTGKYLRQFGLPGDEPGQFNLPHDIVVNNHQQLVVTDRENGRVQVFTQQGHMVDEFHSSMFTNIYSATTFEDYVFMVPGRPQMSHESEGISVFVGRSGTGLIEYAFGPATLKSGDSQRFGQPHNIRVSPDGLTVFIGDIAEGKATLWQFKIQHEESGHMMASNTYITWPTQMNDPKTNSFIILLAFAIIVLGCYYVKRRWKNLQNGGALFDKTGFKPLRTEETVGFISDGSDSE